MVDNFRQKQVREKRRDIGFIFKEEGVDAPIEQFDEAAEAKDDFFSGMRGGFGAALDVSEEIDALEEIHENRSERAKSVDESRSAPVTVNPELWKSNPDEVDFVGVDLPASADVDEDDFVNDLEKLNEEGPNL